MPCNLFSWMARPHTRSYDDGGRMTSSVYNNGITATHTGREWDEELELYHFRARMYDPLTGRFCTRDPIQSPDVPLEAYTYVLGHPTGFFDPSGMRRVRPRTARPKRPVCCTFKQIWTSTIWSESVQCEEGRSPLSCCSSRAGRPLNFGNSPPRWPRKKNFGRSKNLWKQGSVLCKRM